MSKVSIIKEIKESVKKLDVNDTLMINVTEDNGYSFLIGIAHYCPFYGAHFYIVNAYGSECDYVAFCRDSEMTMDMVAENCFTAIHSIITDLTANRVNLEIVTDYIR